MIMTYIYHIWLCITIDMIGQSMVINRVITYFKNESRSFLERQLLKIYYTYYNILNSMYLQGGRRTKI